MTALWESAELRFVPADARMVAGTVAARVGQHSASVIEVARLHLEALDAALALDVPQLLADQLHWQHVRLRSAGATFEREALDVAVREVLGTHLDAAALETVELVQGWAAANERRVTGDEAPEPLTEGPAFDYLMAALSGRRDDAVAVIREAMRAEVDVAEIMLDILQPAQIELGRLWEEGEISIAHEHYTTAITQLALSLLYPRLMLNRTLTGHSMVGATVGLEAHEIGIRMISDLLEHAGWRTAYLGADLPHDEVVEQVAQQRSDVLAVSATMAGHLVGVRDLITELRAEPRCSDVRVLVGGRPFSRFPVLAERVGADATAPGPREALVLCQGWVGEKIGAG